MYVVYTSKSLIADPVFRKYERVFPRSFRDEINGTGVATLRLDLENQNEKYPGVGIDFQPGDWVFILKKANEDYEESDEMSDVLDSRIVWWGYVSSTSAELAKAYADKTGDIQCSQFGHYLALFTIYYDKSFSQGFNPQIDGWYLGNKDGVGIRKTNIGTNPITQAGSHYWKVKEALDFIVANGTNIDLDVDYSKIDMTNTFLNLYESLPSYEGMSLNQALDELCSPYGWKFIFTSTSAVTIQLIDKTGYSTNTPKKIMVTDTGVASLQITEEERKYDGVILEGERILVNFSVTTFHPADKFVGIGPNFTTADITGYVTPTTQTTVNHIDSNPTTLTFRGVTIGTLEDYIGDYYSDELKTDQEGKVKQKLVADAIGNVFNDLESQRRIDRNTYQRYKWLFGSSTGTSGGEWFTTYERPGDYNPGSIIPIFPEVTTQDTSKIFDEFDASFYPVPYITDGVSKNPSPTEFKFAERLLVEQQSETYIEPTFYYRTTTPLVHEINGVLYYPACWYEGTLQRSNGISWRMTPDWYGIQLESPYPEALGCGEDDLVSDPYGDSDWTDPVWNYYHDEWNPDENTNVTPSNYDPHYFQRDKYGIGTWQRMIFSLGAYSNQRITVRAGVYSGERMKIVRDESFQFVINRKGFVWKFTDHYTDSTETVQKPPVIQNHPVWSNSALLPTYTNGNEIVWNDVPEMRKRIKQLYDYYSKDKRAVRVERRIMDADGVELDLTFFVGDFCPKIKEGTKEIWVNSYIASIEYILDGSAPRVIYSTEYPSSPSRTREKVIKGRI